MDSLKKLEELLRSDEVANAVDNFFRKAEEEAIVRYQPNRNFTFEPEVINLFGSQIQPYQNNSPRRNYDVLFERRRQENGRSYEITSFLNEAMELPKVDDNTYHVLEMDDGTFITINNQNKPKIYRRLQGFYKPDDRTEYYQNVVLPSMSKPVGYTIKQYKKGIRPGGAFFNRTLKNNPNFYYIEKILERYGIYNYYKKDKAFFNSQLYNTNCLINILQQYNIPDDKIKLIATKYVFNNFDNLNAINLTSIANDLNAHIYFYRKGDRKKLTDTLKPNGDTINPTYTLHIAEVNNHWFINEEIEMTTGYLIHINEFNHKIKKPYHTYTDPKNKSKNPKLMSFQMIEKMFEKLYDTFFEPIPNEFIINTQLFEDEIILSKHVPNPNDYVKQTLFKPFKRPHEISKNKKTYSLPYRVGVFDTETCVNKDGKILAYTLHSKLFSRQFDFYDNGQYTDFNIPDRTNKFNGFDCGKQFLDHIVQMSKTTKIKNYVYYAHNMKFDLNFIISVLGVNHYNHIELDDNMMCFQFTYTDDNNNKVYIDFRDSYRITGMPLRDFGKSFNLPIHKEIMPYNLYTYDNILKSSVPLSETLPHVKHTEIKEFLTLATPFTSDQDALKMLIYNDDITESHLLNIMFDHHAYASYYCELDVLTTEKGLDVFFQIIIDMFKDISIDKTPPNIYAINSTSGSAHKLMLSANVYENVYSLTNQFERWAHSSIVGGRTCTAYNKKDFTTNKVIPLDINSSYPSAMTEIPGFPIGKPKILSQEDINTLNDLIKTNKYTKSKFINKFTNFFVKVSNLSTKFKMSFPTLSYCDKNGRHFVNDFPPNTQLTINNIDLHDFIEFNEGSCTILEGIYYDEGTNPNIGIIVKKLYNMRLQAKSEGKDALAQTLKLNLNSIYGRTLLDKRLVSMVFKNKDEFENYLAYNRSNVIEYHEYANGKYMIKEYDQKTDYESLCIVGSIILSQSKHGLNKINKYCDKNKLKVYYEDTDSKYMDHVNVKELVENNIVKVGEQLSCMGNDFAEGVYGIYSFFLGKKAKFLRLDLSTVSEKERNKFIIKKGAIIDRNKGVWICTLKGVPRESIVNHYYDIPTQARLLYAGCPIVYNLYSIDEYGYCKASKIRIDKKNFVVKSDVNEFFRTVSFANSIDSILDENDETQIVCEESCFRDKNTLKQIKDDLYQDLKIVKTFKSILETKIKDENNVNIRFDTEQYNACETTINIIENLF